ncbi:MAG: hypothetical protein HY537_14910, partial [Deltaproteobacteria bacterium]|nr:hypothetical protein [Deltaproteobacteria bacterium]
MHLPRFIWLVLFTANISFGSIVFDLMHTRPECHHSGKPTTWCTFDDVATAALKAGMEKRVGQMLEDAEDPEQSRIAIAYFSFSNEAVFKKLCERGKAGIPIEGFFDVSYRGGAKHPGKLAKECQGPSGDNVQVHFLGLDRSDPGNEWRLHHNKFLIVDTGADTLKINFSSGNLSQSGLSIHFDHWVMLEASRKTNLARQHECVIQSMQKALDPNDSGEDAEEDDPDLYRSSLEKCLKKNTLWDKGTEWVEDALKKEKIAPLFSPDPDDRVYKVLAENIDQVVKGGKIYGAIQH